MWERQPDEPGKAYDAFVVYRELGSVRTYRTASKRMGRARHTLEKWGRRHDWQARADAYDAFVRSVAQAEYERGVREEAERWQQRQREHREVEFEMARGLMDKAAAMLQFPLAQIVQEGDDGSTTIIKPTRWSMRDAASLADTAAKLARLSAEMAVPGGASLPQVAQEMVISDADYIGQVLSRLDESGALNRADAPADEPVRAAPAAPATGSGASDPG